MLIQRFKHALLALIISFSGAMVLAPAVAHADFTSDACSGVNSIQGSSCSSNSGKSLSKLLKFVVTLLSFIVGFTAVIMIILSGFRYITAGGDSNSLASARSTLIYAIVGLVIVAVAQTIVHFTLSKASK